MTISEDIYKKFTALVQNCATGPVTRNHRAELREEVNAMT